MGGLKGKNKPVLFNKENTGTVYNSFLLYLLVSSSQGTWLPPSGAFPTGPQDDLLLGVRQLLLQAPSRSFLLPLVIFLHPFLEAIAILSASCA